MTPATAHRWVRLLIVLMVCLVAAMTPFAVAATLGTLAWWLGTVVCGLLWFAAFMIWLVWA